MTPRERFLASLPGEPVDRPSVGNPTSIATLDLMQTTGCYFPDVHTHAERMATLAAAGYEQLGYDTIAPYSPWFKKPRLSGAIGLGGPGTHAGRTTALSVQRAGASRHSARLSGSSGDPHSDRSGPHPQGPIRRRSGADRQSVRPWTLAYHLFGVENFLVLVLDDPDKLRRILERLKKVAVLFGQAQVEAGADCLTLADHLTGDMCRATVYRDFLLPVHQWLHTQLPCPIILHICGRTLDRLDYICHSGFEAFHFDSKTTPGPPSRLPPGECVWSATSTTRTRCIWANRSRSIARYNTRSPQVWRSSAGVRPCR